MTGAESVAVLQAGRGAHRPPLSPQIGWEREENGGGGGGEERDRERKRGEGEKGGMRGKREGGKERGNGEIKR